MSDFSRLDEIASNETSESDALASLSERLKRLEQERKEDQFYFIFVIVLIVDAILFMHLIDGLAALTLGVLELILLMLIADRCDVKYVEVIFKRITGVFKKSDPA